MSGLIITRARGEKFSIGKATVGFCGINKFNEAVFQICAPKDIRIMHIETKIGRKK